MLFLKGSTGSVHSARLSSFPRAALRYAAALSLGLALLLPQHGVAASVDYSSDFHDVIGNGSSIDSLFSIGGSNNLASHAENIYASGNTVNILGGAVVDYGIYGGYHNGTTTSADLTASNNSVTIASGFVGHGTLDIFGGYAKTVNAFSMTASDNTVTINGGTARDVYGGLAHINTFGAITATASGNSVTFNAGTLGSIYGGSAYSHTGGTTHAVANDNTVALSGGTVSNVYGGKAYAHDGNAEAKNNIVTISGGTVLWSVYGGYAYAGNDPAQATGNTVTISGSPNLTAASLYGGGTGFGSAEVFTGNTLNVKTSGLTVANLSNFQYLNFYLPTTVSAGDTVLTVTGTADLTGSAGRSSTVNVGIDGGSSPLLAGDTITLINAGTLVTNSGLNTSASGTGMQGVTLLYNFDISTVGNTLLATVAANAGLTVNEQTKALSEGFVSGLGMVTQGADVAAGQGMDSAVAAAKAGAAAGGGAPVGFGAVSGGSVRYNTGSHVNVNSASLMAGLAWGAKNPLGRLTFGPFVEYGYGSYSTYNSFSNAASVKGDGTTSYYGGGVLGRLDLPDSGPGHAYVEASTRAGGLQNDYKSSDLRDASGRSAEYDSSSMYLGFHLGTGYVWSIMENASLDLYGKYFWTRQLGDRVTLSTGDPIDFKDVDSNRLRIGSRFSYTMHEGLAPYVGAAYEHEFDGKARATTNGYSMKAPSMGGDTGVCELGLVYAPLESLPFSFDLGVQGYVGKREGVTGSLQAKYEF